MQRTRYQLVHVELSAQLDHTDLDLLENLHGYVVEVVSRPTAGGAPSTGVLLDVPATTSRGALMDARRLVRASTDAAIVASHPVARSRWDDERKHAPTAIRVPSAIPSRPET